MNKKLTSAIKDIQDAILEHPFILGMQDGSLPMRNFEYYVVQDTLYLRNYSRILEIIAGRAHQKDHSTFFNKQARAVMEVEMGNLHMKFLERIGADLSRVEMSPTTTAYTDHMYRNAILGTLSEAIISVIPCYIIYRDVASRIHSPKDGPEEYITWIHEYSSETFRESVDGICRVFREIHGPEELSTEEIKTLRKSAYYEHRFWDAAITLEKFQFHL